MKALKGGISINEPAPEEKETVSEQVGTPATGEVRESVTEEQPAQPEGNGFMDKASLGNLWKYEKGLGSGLGQGAVNTASSVANLFPEAYERISGNKAGRFGKVDFTSGQRGSKAGDIGADIGEFLGGFLLPGGAAAKGAKALTKAAPVINKIPQALRTIGAGALGGAAISEGDRGTGAAVGAGAGALGAGLKKAIELYKHSPNLPAKWIQNKYTEVKKEASDIFNDVSKKADERGITGFKIPQSVKDIAHKLPNSKKAVDALIADAEGGNYDAHRKLQTELQKVGVKRASHDLPSVEKQGNEMLAAHKEMIDEMAKHFESVGSKDLSEDLNKAKGIWSNMKTLFEDDKQLANIVTNNRKIPKDALAKFGEDSDSVRRLMKAYPELEDVYKKALTNGAAKEKLIKAAKKVATYGGGYLTIDQIRKQFF